MLGSNATVLRDMHLWMKIKASYEGMEFMQQNHMDIVQLESNLKAIKYREQNRIIK